MVFESESVGSNASNPVSGVHSSNSPNLSSTISQNKQQRSSDICFLCQKRGHWARDCPQKSPKKVVTSSSSQNNLPIVQCPCGSGICIVRTSSTEKNPNRQFYTCPVNSPVSKCKYFRWCDMVRSDEISDAPECDCGAGICLICTETSGPNSGRKYYVCPIKKGHGACSFFRWQQDFQEMTATNIHADESDCSSPQSTLTNCHDTSSPSNNNLVEEGDLSHQGMEIDSALMMDSLEFLQNPSPNSTLSTKDKGLVEETIKVQEDISDEPCRKHFKRLRHGALKIDDSVLEPTAYYCPDMPQAKSGDPTMERALQTSVPTYKYKLHRREAEFQMQLSKAGASLSGVIPPLVLFPCLPTSVLLNQSCFVAEAIQQMLGLHVRGWWGRLVFHPTRCLTEPSSKPFFCCVFPSFDPIFVPGDAVDAFDLEGSTIRTWSHSAVEMPKTNKLAPLTPVTDAQHFDVVPSGPSGLKSPFLKVMQGNRMTGSIRDAFGMTALCVQNDLLTLLESMEFQDHESMAQEANIVFAALSLLSVDYQVFYERVSEFINRATLLANIECSIHNDLSSRALVDWYTNEKLHLDDISRVHAKASADFKTSSERLRSLQVEATRVKDLLFQVETELSCCKDKTVDLGTHLARISQEMFESEKSFQVASEKAKLALELRQQRELHRNAAKVAFEKARSQLRS